MLRYFSQIQLSQKVQATKNQKFQQYTIEHVGNLARDRLHESKRR